MTPTSGAEPSARSRLESALSRVPRRGAERSFKLAPGRIDPERGLFGVATAALSRDAFFRAAGALGMPADYAEALRAEYEHANFFYFGYEDAPGAHLIKLYLEYPVEVSRLTEAEAKGGSRPSPAGVGYKWSSDTGMPVGVTHYTWFVHLPPERILERAAALLGGTAVPAFEVIRDSVSAMASAVKLPVYLEAAEPGSGRRSFDVNVYAAHATVATIADPLRTLAGAYGVADALEPLLEASSDRQLAHFSGGLDRLGRDYLTVYYVDAG